jgi:glycerophosphoryl diester phosphodiesterase
MKKSSLIFFSFIVVLFAYFFAMLSPALYSGNSSRNHLLIKQISLTGHRGAAGFAPENTLSSIKKALDFNTDRIEVDVRQTKDNVVVCLHDETIDRTTNGKGLVNEFTYSDLQKFDAGLKFSKKFKNEKVPTLEEVMQIINGKSKLVVEIKDGDELYPELKKKVVELINKYNGKDWIFVHSFNDRGFIKN